MYNNLSIKLGNSYHRECDIHRIPIQSCHALEGLVNEGMMIIDDARCKRGHIMSCKTKTTYKSLYIIKPI